MVRLRILLVNPNATRQTFIPIGPACISASLKKHGHQVQVFDTFFSVKKGLKEDFGKRLARFKPGLVGISCRELDFAECVTLSKIARSKGILTVLGGPFPTVAPETAIKAEGIDAICLGEAEQAFVELAEKISAKKGFCKTKNFWFKDSTGKISKNEIGPLLEDLDSLPLPDWDAFLKESKKFEVVFISSRGCPFHCTYCINHRLQRLYSGKGKYVRLRSPDSMIAEVKLAAKKYGLKTITFVDDAFTVNRKRLLEFAEKYKNEIGLPFWMITRADMVDFETFVKLKEAGLESVSMGIESGNEFISREVMKRQMPRQTIVNAFKAAKQAGVQTHSFNMIGVPFETEQSIWDTINMNREIQPSAIQASIFSPYTGTDLRDIAEKEGFVSNERAKDFWSESILHLPNLSAAKIEAYQKTIWLYVYSPKALFPLIHAFRKFLELNPKQSRKALGWASLRAMQVAGLIKRRGFMRTGQLIKKRLLG